MQSRNAVGNLINRYRAVLKKCHLLNTFGTLAMVAALTVGAVGASGFMPTNAFSASYVPTLQQPDIGNYLLNMTYDHDNDPTTEEVSAGLTQADLDALASNYVIFKIDPSTTEVFYKTFTVKEVADDGTLTTTTYGIRLKRDLLETSDIDDFISQAVVNHKSAPYEIHFGHDGSVDMIINGAYYSVYTDNTHSTPLATAGIRVDTDQAGADVNGNFFLLPTVADGGGAIYNNATSIGNINGNFVGNTASDGDPATLNQGGAIYNSYSGSIGDITGSFVGNTSVDEGGAIANYHTAIMGNIDADFIGNSATGASSSGGAISNNNSSTTGNINGDFIGNSATYYGGAIYNDTSTIGNITGNFISNTTVDGVDATDSYGGAIFNNGNGSKSSIIGNITGNFIGNSADYAGGAIYNYYANIANITGDFIGNKAGGGGGAIFNSNANVGNVTGDFINNSAAMGGAIAGSSGTIGNVTGDFIGNIAAYYGGAITSLGLLTLGNITGDFSGNEAGGGGAIFLGGDSSAGNIVGDFTNNKATVASAGAIAIGSNTTIGNITGDFIGNEAAKDGGAITSIRAGHIDDIKGNFINNIAGTDGGAIANMLGVRNAPDGDDAPSSIGDITGIFSGNIAHDNDGNPATQSVGGAIYNFGSSIGKIDATFNYNKTESGGGAIANFVTGATEKIESIAGSFTGNTSDYFAGAIMNYAAKIGNIDASFTDNTAGSAGGAIYNYDGSTIGDINGNFTANTAGGAGGAIHNYYYATIGNITGDFSGNIANNNDGVLTPANLGGAIYNSNATIGNIKGSFTNNSTESGGGAIANFESGSIIGGIEGLFEGNSSDFYAGAIMNFKGQIDSINASFINNQSVHMGGAIANVNSAGTAIIGDIVGDFSGNKSTAGSGGAIAIAAAEMGRIAGDFTGNSAFEHGGAIYNTHGTLGILSGSFTNNHAGTNGGAIYTNKNITFEADSERHTISNNTIGAADTLAYNAIHFAADGKILNFNLNNSGHYILNDSVTAEGSFTYDVNITGDGSNGNTLFLSNKLAGADIITLENAALNFNSYTHSNGTISHGSIDNATLNIHGSSELRNPVIRGDTTIVAGATVGVYPSSVEGVAPPIAEFGVVTNEGNLSLNSDAIFNGVVTSTGDITLNGESNFTAGLTVDGGTTYLQDDVTGNITVNNASLVVDSSGLQSEPVSRTANGNISINGTSTLEVGAKTLFDVSNATLTVASTATKFETMADGILKAKASDFGTFNANGTVDTTGANVGKVLTNNGELILTGLADTGAIFEHGLHRIDSIDFINNIETSGFVTGSGSIDLAGVNLTGLYSLTRVDEDNAFQSESQNIMAGNLISIQPGTGRRVIAAGVVKNDYDNPDLTASTIAAGNILELSGNNTGNILLDEGSITNSGSLFLGVASVAYTSNFNGDLTIETSADTTISSDVNITGATTINGGLLEINDNASVSTGNVILNTNGNLGVINGSLDVSNGTLTVASDAGDFSVYSNGTLKAKASDFGTFNADGSVTANIGKAIIINNNGELILTGLADVGAVYENGMSRSAKAQLKEEVINAGLVSSSSGTITYADVDTTGLYSLTWVDENDVFQSSSQNIMAGNLTNSIQPGTSRIINAAGIEKNSDHSPNLTDSTIGADTILNLSGNNVGNILLDEGSITTSGLLSLGELSADYTSNFNGSLITSAGGTTEIFGNVNINGTSTVNGGQLVIDSPDKLVTTGDINVNSGSLVLVAGTLDVSNSTLKTDASSTLVSEVGSKLIVNNAAIGKEADGITNIATGATVNENSNVDYLLGSVIIEGVTGTLDYASTYGDLRTAGQKAFGTKASMTFEGIQLDMGNATLEHVLAYNDNTLGGQTIKMGANPITIPAGSNIAVGAISNANGQTLTIAGGGLTLTGNTSAENEGKLYDGEISLAAGSTLTTGTGSVTKVSNTGGTMNVVGATVVEELVLNGGSVDVGSPNSAGSLTAKVVNANGGTLFHDPAWIDGVGIDGATTGVYQSFTNNAINGSLVAGQNSYVVVGDANTNWAKQSFANSGLTWGQNTISAALFVNIPQSIDTTQGAIHVDGSLTTASAPVYNTATFNANSLLVVNAANLNNSAAIKATAGKLTVDDKSTLLISNPIGGTTITIADGFSNASTVDGWGVGETLSLGKSETLMTDSRAVGVGSSAWDATTGTYTAKLVAMQVNLPYVNQSVNNFLTEAGNANLVGANKTLVDYVNNTTTDARIAASTIQGSVQAAAVVGTNAIGADVSSVVASSVEKRNSISTLGINEKSVASVALNDNEVSVSTGGDITNRDNGFGVWLMPLFSHSSVSGMKSDSFKSGYSSTLGGVAFGADYTMNNMYRFGAAFNAGGGSTSSSGDLLKADNSYSFWGFSLYGGLRFDNLALNADFGYSGISNDISQGMPLGSGLLGSSSDPSTGVWSFGLNAEYLIATSFADFIPYLGIRYQSISTDSHSINNGASTLFNVAESSQNIVSLPLGVNVEKDIMMNNGWGLTPSADLGMKFTFGDLDAQTKASMAGVASSVNVKMENIDSVAFVGGIGVDLMSPSKNMTFGLDYDLQASSNEVNHGLQATFRFEF